MKINEIFYSLQGEGFYTGTAAVFIRFSGCNLKCPFCDTSHEQGGELTEEDNCQEITGYPCRHVVLTGGEPMLQLTERLITMLHNAGKFIQVETNGTIPIESHLPIDWVTCSPKFDFCSRGKLRLQRIDELKVVYQGQDMSVYEGIDAKEYYLQPCDTKDASGNSRIVAGSIDYIKGHPQWHLSLQTQKIIHVR